MNKKIYYDKNGDIKVYNEEAIPKKVAYQDNIEEVLALQNIVEGLTAEYENYQKQMVALAKQRKQIKNKIKEHKSTRRIWLLLQLVLFPIILVIGTSIILNTIGNPWTHTIFGLVGSTTFHAAIAFALGETLLTIGTFSFGHLYQDIKNSQLTNKLNEEINGYNIALIASKKLLEKKKEELENLENIKNFFHKMENVNVTKDVKYQEELLFQKAYLIRMRRYGENEDYYQKLLHHNDLFDKIYEHYTMAGQTRKRTLNLGKEDEKRKRNIRY